ncbi:phospholipase [Microbacterium sp. P06]|uniref:aggregation-promoting factor C-terminal-like domain-containing protein n=1 Tax=unclassified Microbacterium TaxID=2609290 RepID=UPI003746685D
MPTHTKPARTRITFLAAAACAGVALSIVATAATAAASPLSGPVAASASLVREIAAVAPIVAETPAIDDLTISTSEAQTALDDAREAQTEATTVMTTIAESGLAERIATPTVDTTDLRASISSLAKTNTVPVLLFPELADDAETQAATVDAQVSVLRGELDAARAQKAAEDAAAEAAAQAQRDAEAAAQAAQAAAEAQAAANTPAGAQSTARAMAAERYGWGGDQFSCLVSLWQKESGWNYKAYNASSGATGIPQALPGSKMASVGSDWQTNAATQVAWGLQYISAAYGSPCSAWGHSQSTNWY